MSQKRGRPPSENPKDEMIRVRMDKKSMEILDYCAEKLRITRSEVIRTGIKKVEAEIKKE